MGKSGPMGAQPTLIPPRMSTSPMNLQPPTKIPSLQMPSNFQPQRLPYVDAHQHIQRIILLTIQIHHPHVRPGLKVQTGKELSRVHQRHPLPRHQWESQDLWEHNPL